MEEDESKFSYYKEFFKVYLSHLSSTEMVIPPAFMALMQIDQLTVPKNVTLKDFNGKIWNVVLERKKDDWIIKDGWKDFASYHSFVDGCAGGKGSKPCGTLPAVATTLQAKDEPVAVEKPVGIQPAVPSSCAGGSGSKRRRTLPAMARTPVFVKRDKPCFVWNMTETNRYVNIPILVLKAHGIKIPRVMQLRDKKKKLWSILSSFLDNGQIRLTTGWMEFCRKKKLEVGDQCVLEFILSKDNVSYVIEVRVLRRRSGARSVKYGLAVALKRKHSARKMNPAGQNTSKGGTGTGWKWCEDKAERMEPVVLRKPMLSNLKTHISGLSCNQRTSLLDLYCACS